MYRTCAYLPSTCAYLPSACAYLVHSAPAPGPIRPPHAPRAPAAPSLRRRACAEGLEQNDLA